MIRTTDILTGRPIVVDVADDTPASLEVARRESMLVSLDLGYETFLAAALLGLTPSATRRRLRSGQLPGKRQHGLWMVPARTIAELLGAPYLRAVADALGWTCQDVAGYIGQTVARAA